MDPSRPPLSYAPPESPRRELTRRWSVLTAAALCCSAWGTMLVIACITFAVQGPGLRDGATTLTKLGLAASAVNVLGAVLVNESMARAPWAAGERRLYRAAQFTLAVASLLAMGVGLGLRFFR